MNYDYEDEIRNRLSNFIKSINNGGKISASIANNLSIILDVKNSEGLTTTKLIKICGLNIKEYTFNTTLNREIKKRNIEQNNNAVILKPDLKEEVKTKVLTKESKPKKSKPNLIDAKPLKFNVNDWGDNTMLNPKLQSSKLLFMRAEKCGLEPVDFLGLESYKNIYELVVNYEKQLNVVFKNPRRDFYKDLNIFTEDELKKHYFKEYKLSYDD